ncbi:hypothetical protein [Rhodococcus sp. EPR-157]|uniref:hypothetical protein n=1 Tax=Rhodococcus sp. EPR-157 TaxID=1813677 RepID=UPI000AB25E23|nr:hypothetical protein [Rhodococcus sp. EPR-157]
MAPVPAVESSRLITFEKSARIHHKNVDGELPDTEFKLLLNVAPETLGVRIQIIDQFRHGTVRVDVAVVYQWERDAVPADDLDEFTERVALPQVLSCAAATLTSAASEIVSNEVPFYGLSALDEIVSTFRQRTSLAERLKHVIEERTTD